MKLNDNISKNNNINILLRPESEVKKRVRTDFVFDFNWQGKVIGIEILNLKFLSGTKCLDNFQNDLSSFPVPLSYSYDEEVDAFYLRFSRERSPSQRSAKGELLLDNNGYIIGFKVAL